jgi:hypothetical protein
MAWVCVVMSLSIERTEVHRQSRCQMSYDYEVQPSVQNAVVPIRGEGWVLCHRLGYILVHLQWSKAKA